MPDGSVAGAFKGRRSTPESVDVFRHLDRGVEPKSASAGHRAVPVEDTWQRVATHLHQTGVTRLADITGLDRLGIPVYQAVVPRSEDTISTYGGKGTTRLAAKVSAAMEALERFCACLPPPVAVIASQRQLTGSRTPFLAPEDLCLELDPDFDEDAEIGWCWGFDLVSRRPLLVSSEQSSSSGLAAGALVNPVSTTNGIASGNTYREAILHGLYEVVERDSWTTAHALGQALPALAEARGVPDFDPGVLHPVDLASLPADVRSLAARFEASGVRLQVLRITSDFAIPTVIAIATEDHTLSGRHAGLGTDADALLAITRAVTEVAQSRAGDNAGGREDMSQADEDVPRWMLHTKRSGDAVPWRSSRETVELAGLGGYASDDIATDLALTLRRVVDAGLDRVVVVDLSVAELEFPVCRVLVPGAESWAVDRSAIGPRLLKSWNDAVRNLSSHG